MNSQDLSTAGPVIFTLIPCNDAAMEVVKDERNKSFCKRPRQSKAQSKIYVTFNPHRPEGIYPSTIGHNGHIKLSRPFSANNQCSFQIHKDTGEVMLIDNSPGQTCYVECVTQESVVLDFSKFGAMVICPFADEINLRFGGKASSLYRWTIKWRMRGPIDMQAWAEQAGFHARIGQDMTLRSLPSIKRLESFGGQGPKPECRYFPREEIERKRGSWIYKGIDALTGHLVAIKTIVDHIPGRYREEGESCREITTDLDHPHVMEFFQVEIMTDHLRLIMELQDGDVGHLAHLKEFKEAQGLFGVEDNVGRPLLHQMLQALDYLESKDIIHRDVKPQNILYRRIGNSIHYRLADFGIATTAPHPLDGSGTRIFMAPEVRFMDLDFDHTPKIDIWSLCASMCWLFGFEIVWYGCFIVDDGVRSVSPEWNEALTAMAEMDPMDRVSAGEVLTVMFGGAGRVTTG